MPLNNDDTLPLNELISKAKIEGANNANTLIKRDNETEQQQAQIKNFDPKADLSQVQNRAQISYQNYGRRLQAKENQTLTKSAAIVNRVQKTYITVDNLKPFDSDEKKLRVIRELLRREAYQEGFENAMQTNMNVLKSVHPSLSREAKAEKVKLAINNVDQAHIELNKLNNLSMVQRGLKAVFGNLTQEKANALFALKTTEKELEATLALPQLESPVTQKAIEQEQTNAIKYREIVSKKIDRLKSLSRLISDPKKRADSGLLTLIDKEKDILQNITSKLDQSAVINETLKIDRAHALQQTPPPPPTAKPSPPPGRPPLPGLNQHVEKQKTQPKLSARASASTEEKKPIRP